MTATGLSASDRSTLHVFRPVARDVDAALRLTPPGRQALRVVNGYVESDRDAGRMRKLCIRVRRISLARDPINFLSGAGDRPAVGSGPLAGQAKALAQRFAPIAEELESVSVFGDRRVTNGEAYETRIDARVFVEAPDRTGRYRRMVSEPEPAIEGIAMHLGDRIAKESRGWMPWWPNTWGSRRPIPVKRRRLRRTGSHRRRRNRTGGSPRC